MNASDIILFSFSGFLSLMIIGMIWSGYKSSQIDKRFHQKCDNVRNTLKSYGIEIKHNYKLVNKDDNSIVIFKPIKISIPWKIDEEKNKSETVIITSYVCNVNTGKIGIFYNTIDYIEGFIMNYNVEDKGVNKYE